MNVVRGRTYLMSELTVDANIDMNSFGFTECGNLTLVKNSGIQMLSILPADGDWCGHTVLDQFGENVSRGETIYLKNDSKVWLSDANDAAKMPVKGIAVADVLAGAIGVILQDGFIRKDAWTWTVPNVLVPSATPGALVETTPSGSGDQIQRVAIVVATNIINFRPSKDVLEIE